MKLSLKKTGLKGILAGAAAVGTAVLAGAPLVPFVLLKIFVGTFLATAGTNAAKHGKRVKTAQPQNP